MNPRGYRQYEVRGLSEYDRPNEYPAQQHSEGESRDRRPLQRRDRQVPGLNECGDIKFAIYTIKER